MTALDRNTFIKPIAHRGLHNVQAGIVENTAPAFEAALKARVGIECDLQPSADGTPFVFHDETLDRLTSETGRIDARSPSALRKIAHRDSGARIMSFAEFLNLVDGRQPLLVEIKSEWTPPRTQFLKKIAALANAYKGPLALMSFDPAQMAAMTKLAPGIPRGIVSGIYKGKGWDVDKLGPERAERLTNLLESHAAEPAFYSYDVRALPGPVTRYVREVQRLPLFCWTVRTASDWATANQWADAATFEGAVP